MSNSNDMNNEGANMCRKVQASRTCRKKGKNNRLVFFYAVYIRYNARINPDTVYKKPQIHISPSLVQHQIMRLAPVHNWFVSIIYTVSTSIERCLWK